MTPARIPGGSGLKGLGPVDLALRCGLLRVAGATEALEWVLAPVVLDAQISAPAIAQRLERFRLILIRAQGFFAELAGDPRSCPASDPEGQR